MPDLREPEIKDDEIAGSWFAIQSYAVQRETLCAADHGIVLWTPRSSQVYQGAMHKAHPGRPELPCPAGCRMSANTEGPPQ